MIILLYAFDNSVQNLEQIGPKVVFCARPRVSELLEMRLKDGLYEVTNLKSEITNLKFGKARILAPLISRPRKILVFFYVSLKMSIVM